MWWIYYFKDGYMCYYAYPLKGIERRNEIKAHGAIVKEEVRR